MIKIQPNTMKSGDVTGILIVNENSRDIVEIPPIAFDVFIQDNTRGIISKYYLKKKTCENLVQQLEIAQSEFKEAKDEFDTLTGVSAQTEVLKHTPPPVKEPAPEPKPYIPPAREISPPTPPEEPLTEPEPPAPPLFTPEPVVVREIVESAPAPSPPSLEEMIENTLNSDGLKALIENNQLSDATLREVVLKYTPREWEDTVRGKVIEQLKERGIIELSILEKLFTIGKKRPRQKVPK